MTQRGEVASLGRAVPIVVVDASAMVEVLAGVPEPVSVVVCLRGIGDLWAVVDFVGDSVAVAIAVDSSVAVTVDIGIAVAVAVDIAVAVAIHVSVRIGICRGPIVVATDEGSGRRGDYGEKDHPGAHGPEPPCPVWPKEVVPCHC